MSHCFPVDRPCSDGGADRLSWSQRRQQCPEKRRRGKSSARRYQITQFAIFPIQTPKNVQSVCDLGGRLPEPSKHICFCYLCRSPDVAAGPRGGRGRSQWRTATHPKRPWRATCASWTTDGSSYGPSVQTCPSQRLPGCWATSGASCPLRRSRSVKTFLTGSHTEHIIGRQTGPKVAVSLLPRLPFTGLHLKC